MLNHAPIHSAASPARFAPAAGAARRRGTILVYLSFLMIVLLALISLGVDFIRMQVIRTQMQRSADVSARGILQMYNDGGPAVATAVGPAMASNTYNPVEQPSGVMPTSVITYGTWNAATKTFTAGAGTPLAVRVVISRTAATGNPVSLIFPVIDGMSGIRTKCDVTASAIAVLQAPVTTTTTVAATADLWLAGMPAGSNAGWSDNPSNAPPVLAMSVIPGTVMTFAATGLTMYSGPVSTLGADGGTNSPAHMSGSPDGNYNGLQNGIQTMTAPQNALSGVFLSNAQPSTQTPPAAGLDYSATASREQANYTALKVQQPFFIGNGTTALGMTQSFVVPPGATRLFLGVYDGWQNCDNPGALTVTIKHQARVYLVK